ncbi:gamma-interferon-inducible lysosomal thiol reductase-like [Sipha flava]|uniref:Gamma-interferon-inducible lysosomal thiol reductase-like n=1 Tax=Sipha flava TaxID=143950 RepID=A0A8B8F694_9HEMI|nr:gamma-interferon-inducible lysosomal thiol reductase-like [Sipha flava]
MITSSILSIILLLVIVAITCSVDVVGTKKVSLKPSYDFPLVENQNAVPKITVSIYYSSLCTDCISLFKNQIGPNLVKFHKYVNFYFIPFGNTEKKLFDGRWFFKCQNGLNECMKNKWQVCSIQVLLSKRPLLASYLVCYMNSTNEIHSGYQCTRKLGLYNYYSKIKKCFMNREFSDSLMIRYSYLTQRVIPKLTPIPSITFNGIYNETEQYDAKNNLGIVICKHLHPKPVEMC